MPSKLSQKNILIKILSSFLKNFITFGIIKQSLARVNNYNFLNYCLFFLGTLVELIGNLSALRVNFTTFNKGNKMKKILTFALLGTLVGNAWAGEDTGKTIAPYISLRLGAVALSTDLNGVNINNSAGGAIGGAIGAKFILGNEINVRAEGEFAYNSASFTDRWGDKITQTPMTFMANAYLDFLTSYKLKPYVGFGLGMMNFNEKDSSDITSDVSLSDFAYGIYGGAGFNFNESGSLMGDVGIRYTSASFKYNGSDVDVSAISYNFGVRYTF